MRNLQHFLGAACLLLAASPARAVQTAGTDPPQINCIPATDGQWAGPWELNEQINPPGDFLWNEIAHCFVLPPPNEGRIVFLCQRKGNGPPCSFMPAEAFLWNSADPSNVEATLRARNEITLSSIGVFQPIRGV